MSIHDLGDTEVEVLHSDEHAFCLHSNDDDTATLINLTTWSLHAKHNLPWMLVCPGTTWRAVPLGDYVLLFWTRHSDEGEDCVLMVLLFHGPTACTVADVDSEVCAGSNIFSSFRTCHLDDGTFAILCTGIGLVCITNAFRYE